MTIDKASDVRQPGLIVAFARRLEGRNSRFGKTALQKLVYLLQETQGVPTGYRFTFYNHGPFSSELAADLTYLDWLDVVDVSYFDGGRGGFAIKTGPKAEEALAEARTFIDRYSSQIDRIMTDFGPMTAKELELRATVVFVERDSRRRGQCLSQAALAAQVQDLKPQFAPSEIGAAITELREKGYICTDEDGT